MGAYYDHASMQMRALARAHPQCPDRSPAVRAEAPARSVRNNDGEGARGLAAGALAVVLALVVASPLTQLAANGAWAMLGWRALFSLFLLALAAMVSSLARFIAG